MTGQTMQGLQATALSWRLGARAILDGVSVAVAPGQWLAIVGPNGAGKSTLLRALAGLLQPDAGDVRWQREALHRLPARTRAREIAWLGQDTPAQDDMLVRDVVALGRLPHRGWWPWSATGGDAHADARAIAQALQDTGLQDVAARRMGELSGGERQRVWLARALAVQAAVLLLDEPVAHLDAPHQRLIARVLRREAARGVAVISVLHELPLAMQADALAVLHEGRLLACGTPADAAVHDAMAEAFGHAVQVRCVDGQWLAVPDFR